MPVIVNPLTQSGHKQMLGFGAKTISQSGCLMTAFAMIVNTMQGTRYTPVTMNDALKAARAFAGSNLILEKAASRFQLKHERQGVDDAGVVKLALDLNVPVIVGVDYKAGRSSGYSQADHFIVIVRQADDEFIAIDPGNGREVRLDAALQRTFEIKTMQGTKTVTWEVVELITFREVTR